MYLNLIIFNLESILNGFWIPLSVCSIGPMKASEIHMGQACVGVGQATHALCVSYLKSVSGHSKASIYTFFTAAAVEIVSQHSSYGFL